MLTINCSPNVQQSVISVLATAIPRETLSYALASQSAFAAEMASNIAAGKTPAWYASLPADVKTLLPAIYPVVAAVTPTPSASSSSSHVTASISARPTGVNSTSITSVRTPTLSASGSGARSSAPAQATGAASAPSVAMGAGFAAVMGAIGMLAL